MVRLYWSSQCLKEHLVRSSPLALPLQPLLARSPFPPLSLGSSSHSLSLFSSLDVPVHGSSSFNSANLCRLSPCVRPLSAKYIRTRKISTVINRELVPSGHFNQRAPRSLDTISEYCVSSRLPTNRVVDIYISDIESRSQTKKNGTSSSVRLSSNYPCFEITCTQFVKNVIYHTNLK